MIFKITPGTKYSVAERRRKIAEVMSKNPGITRNDLARMLKVGKETISRDIKAMTEDLNLQTIDDFLMHRERVLAEIRAQKLECQNRLDRCVAAQQGSRWMQEWTSLIEKECKILGMFTPDKVLAAASKIEPKFSKTERDAAVAAVIEADVIEIPRTGKPGRPRKNLVEQPTS